MKKMILGALTSALVFSGAAQAATNQEIIENVASNVILATYTDLANKAADLQTAVNTLVQDPTQQNLELAQDAWRAARIPWESSESFLFGPVDSLGIDPMLDIWPLNRADLVNVLKNSKKIDADFVRNLGANLQGFHTIEFLLFGDGIQTNTRNISTFDSQQFDYLVATSTLLAEYTGQLAHAWSTQYNPEDSTTPGYVDVISKPGLQNPIYSSERAVLEEYIQGMIVILDEVANGKMSDPFGSDISHANVELVESPYSWNSLSDFQNNLVSVYNVYTGSNGSHTGAGIRDFVKEKDLALSERLEFEILKSIQLVGKIAGPNKDMPFRRAILDAAGRERIQLAIDQLNKTRTLVEERVLPLLD